METAILAHTRFIAVRSSELHCGSSESLQSEFREAVALRKAAFGLQDG